MKWQVVCSCLLAIFLSTPLLAQLSVLPAEASGGVTTLISDDGGAASDNNAPAKVKDDSVPDPNKLRVVIYPVLGVAPIFGINVNVPEPSIPSHPIAGGGNVSGSASSSLNGAAFFGFTVEKKWFYAEGNGMWTSLTASRTSTNTFGTLNISTDWWTGGGFAGVRFYRDFYATAGFHTLSLSYDIDFTGYPTFHRSPSFWDPMFGVLWKRRFNRKWELRGNVEGGGFGVGSDEDISARAQADWEFVRHFGLTFGWELIHVSFSRNLPDLDRTFTASQTINGPMFGLGIYF